MDNITRAIYTLIHSHKQNFDPNISIASSQRQIQMSECF